MNQLPISKNNNISTRSILGNGVLFMDTRIMCMMLTIAYDGITLYASLDEDYFAVNTIGQLLIGGVDEL